MSRSLLLAVVVIAGFAGGVVAQAPKPDAGKIVGVWKVDLRPRPDAPASYTQFEIKTVEDKTLTGTFYNSEIRNGQIDIEWGAVYFAFTTQDSSGGAYNTTGKLVGDRLEGTTHAVDRKFLRVWTAEREK